MANVQSLVPDGSGGVYVFDGRMGLRQYDSNGGWVRTIGGFGSGPAEHGENAGVARLRDGRILLADQRNARINLYQSDGRNLSTPVRRSLSRN
jgi:hypothetical protein